MSILEVTDLETRFYTDEGTVKAVRDVSFSIPEGDIVGLVGESGSGKSVTALSIMNLVDNPGRIEGGEILFEGENLLEKSESEMQSIRGERIGMVFQDPMTSLNPAFPVGDQIAETIEKHWDYDRDKAWDRAIELLEQVEIPNAKERIHEYPHQFSGGMRQRVLIAIALACDPDLLIADEPTTALDVTIQAQLLNLLEDLQEEFRLSVLLITHDLGIVAEIADSLVVMYAGSVVERGDVQELFYEPQHPYLKRLLASNPHHAGGDSELLPVIEGKMPDLVHIPSGCPFHPRCPDYIGDVCETEEPELFEAGETPGHVSACHLHNDQVDAEPGEDYYADLPDRGDEDE